MKLTTLFLTFFWLHVTARTDAQTVTLSVKNAPVKQVLLQVQKQTGFNIMVEEQLLDKAGKVTLKVKDASVEAVLRLCFKQEQFLYSLEDRTIVVRKSTPAETVEELAAEITGKITDEEGNPLAKVSVYNITTKKGVISNDEGTFRIQASQGDVIQFSYVGFITKQVKITEGTTTLTMKLERRASAADEVIITGYQNVQKSKMTGSVSKVKAEDLLLNGATTIEQALQGKMPGVEIVNNSGQIGTRQTVRVRGVSTLLGNQEPVWVVDGIIQEDPLPFQAKELNRFNQEPSGSELLKNFIGSAIAWLNPYDIEEVTVLKDAASTAIYGVKAANGVILITTKRGKAGRAPVVSYNASISTQSMLTYDKLNLMNSKERIDVSREIWEKGLTSTTALDNVGYSGLLKQYLEQKLSYDEFNAGVKQLEVNNTNWFDVLYQRPVNQSHSLSVSGGSGNSSYYGSFGANMQKGQAKGNGQTGYQGSVSFTTNITSRLAASVKIAGGYAKTDGFYNTDPYKYATTTSRVIPAYNEDGTLSYYNYWNSGLRFNVLNELSQSGNSNTRTNLNTGISIRYRFSGGFMFESLFGANYSNVSSEAYATERSYAMTRDRGYEYGTYGPNDQQFKMSRLPFGGILVTGNNSNYNYTWRNGLNYGRTFNKVHVVTGLLGMELRSNIYKATNATVYGYMPDRGKVVIMPPGIIQNSIGSPVENLLYSADLINTTITDRTANYVSYYSSGSYTYDNRYVMSVSLRGDASNRFGQDTRARFKPIWAVGGRWNVANEKFFRKTSWLNDLSVRASYGFQGNVAENFGPDLIIKIPAGTNAISNLTGEPIYRISNMPYSNLRWEKTQTVNLGLDFNFLGGRIGASLDYYNKRSRDLIVMKDVPFENGVTQMPVKSGTLNNSGIDLSLNFIPVRTKDFTWTVGINSARNFNKVTSRQVQNPTWNTAKSGTYYVEGYAVSSFWVFDFAGLDSATGIPLINLPTTAQNPNVKFDAAAFMKYAGKFNADFTGGFNTSFRYKTLTVSSSMYLSTGAHKLLAQLYSVDMIRSTPYEYNNLPQLLVNRWRKPGDHLTTDIPSLPQATVGFLTIPSGAQTFGNQSQGSSETPYTLYNFSTARVVNASFLRVNNISVSYSLPAKIAKRIFSKTAMIGYSISNVYTFVSRDYKGLDPEVAAGSQPLPRIHAFNLAITF
ncbi:MAG: SusC/RagA family TonB-linked outer membrane protein [Chitinophagaceae bacterium]|nr:SusC/RagA family TonB-linked outer membrane protein [Chitinophagaceae bacterium]